MSGHSKWSTIKRAKGVADAKRGQTFTKIANNITLAAKLGGSGDGSNPRLRLALEQAKSANMPKDNIQRAIDRGLAQKNLPGQTIEGVLYEGFGPSRVAFIIEGITDNKLRTNQEVKNLFDRAGGSIVGQGSASYMFDKKGEIRVKGKGRNGEEEILEIIDLGAEDVEDFKEEGVNKYLVYVEATNLNQMSNNLTQSDFEVESAELVYKPSVHVEISNKDEADRILSFIEKLEDHNDIQKVFANFDIPEELIANN